MKRYSVIMNRGWVTITKRTNSLKVARILANLRIWDCAKIYDLSTGCTSLSGRLPYVGKCIHSTKK